MVDIQTDIILVAWIINQELFDLTQSAITSLKELGNNRLIIVDNASPMGGGYLREQADIYIRNQKNLGYAPATNEALRMCTSEFVLFAQNDTFPTENILEVGKEILQDKSVTTVHYRMYLGTDKIVKGSDTWLTGKERWCSFGLFLARRNAIPYLDENYIMANYEDYDFLQTVRSQGFKTAYTNKAAYHHGDATTQKFLDQGERNKNSEINKEYFKQKWGMEPDPLFRSQFPEQWESPWYPFP